MSLRRLVSKLAVLLAPLALVAGSASPLWAQAVPSTAPATGAASNSDLRTTGMSCITGSCGAQNAAPATCAALGSDLTGCGAGCTATGGCAKCQKCNCPPALIHCTPAPPKIKFKCNCPKPICDPCNLDPTGNYGYVPTCWRPWMAPPNYSHCPVPTPTELMARGGMVEVAPAPLPVPAPAPVTPDNAVPLAPHLESRNVAPPTTLPHIEEVAAVRTNVAPDKAVVPPPAPLGSQNVSSPLR